MQTEIPQEPTTTTPQPHPAKDSLRAGQLAAGLLWQDRIMVLLLYPLLVLPGVITIYTDFFSSWATISSVIIERFLQIIVLAVLGVRAINRVAIKPSNLSLRQLKPLLSYGLLFWAIIALPTISVLFSDSDNLRVGSLFFVAPGIAIAYQYYFYFFGSLLPIPERKNLLPFVRSFVTGDRFLPLRVELIGFASMALISGLLFMPYPDGRSLTCNLLSEAAGGIAWVFSSYVGIAYGLLRLSQPEWRSFELDHYRDGRIDTLCSQGPNWLGKILTPAVAFKILLFVMLIWGSIFYSSAHTPPAAESQVKKISVEAKKVTIEISLTDNKYLFLGFRPQYFSIAGEQRRVVIAPSPTRAAINGEELSKEDLTIKRQPNLELTLEFDSQEQGLDLSKLKDLYLWYKGVRLFQIKPLDLEDNQPAKQLEDQKKIGESLNQV